METSFSERAASRLTSRTTFSLARPRVQIAYLLLLALACLAASAVPTMAQDNNVKCPPPTRVEDANEIIHGVAVSDPYRWLEDQNSRETRAWIDAQNACTQSLLKTLPGSEAIAKRLGELIKVDTIRLPIERGGRYFYSKRAAGQDLFVLYMRRGTGPEEVLMDPASLSSDHTTSVNFDGISDDGKLVAYGVRKGGEDEVAVHFIDTDTHKEIADSLPRARYLSGTSFKIDKSGFYYSKLTEAGPRAYYHAMGTSAEKDAMIFGDGYGPDKLISANVSENGRYLLLTAIYGSACEKSEIYFQDLAKGGPITPVVKTIGSCFQGEIAGDTLYLQTNWKAPKWRVLSVPLANPAQENWKETIPENQSRLESFRLVGGKLIAQYSHNAVSELKVFEADGKAAGEISLPALGDVNGIAGRWQNPEAFLSFQSFAIPSTIYRFDVVQRSLTVWAKPAVPVDTSQFEVKQIWYESKDKTRVPMFLFYKKGLKLDGSNPVLMTAYGGFDVSETPAFRDDAIVWAEHGGVFALPNLRGGGEFGEDWHHAGMLEKKQNVFDDFFAAAEWLIANHYTRPERLAIIGRSNGGLLMGAAMTQRPDLFGAIVCGYPLLDMVRYQKFLVARFWVTEYGSSDNPQQFPFIFAYSPYHHVIKGTKYPAVLFLTGDSDTRVAPLHARKMTAEMQAAQAGDKPILLMYDTKLGHSEGRPVSKIIEEDTDVLQFLFAEVGAKNF
ncbi:MAG TPA: prolyl oligopeptidase family serine peptidase [Candidatus Acidoferrales bacterium]|nr:prolyl oligopeptidase family serine peptidase [Candidatus Acidoferrales bacterium]